MKTQKKPMRTYKIFALFAILIWDSSNARGVSPYLPMNLDPSLLASIERVFLLADQPVMTKPIALAQILDALPAACAIDEANCLQVRSYLSKFMKDSGINQADIQVSHSFGNSELILPNQHGANVVDTPLGNISASYQPSDYLLFNLGASINNSKFTPSATYLSAGWGIAQLDIGYRDLWLSPFTDHALMLSTEAPTMPSISISNYDPIGTFAIQYQISLSRMGKSDRIKYLDGYTSGNPYLAGLNLQAQPTAGYSISLTRLLQYGGGARGSSGGLNGFLGALLDPSHKDNALNPTYDANQEFGNQIASISFQQILPTRYPTKIYAEYGGEDTLNGSNWKLGNLAASLGFKLTGWMGFMDLTAEASEWQNGWYAHHLYQDGLTNEGKVIGGWFGDQRHPGDAVGGNNWFIQAGWATKSGYFQTKYRTLSNQDYGLYNYHRAHELSIDYSHPLLNNTLNSELLFGKDVFGKNYSRISATYRFGHPIIDLFMLAPPEKELTEAFFDYGISQASPRIVYGDDITGFKPIRGKTEHGPHAGIGMRRQVSDRNDLGMRLEFDRVSGRQLFSLRTLDWRYRFEKYVATSLFIGFARYDWRLPAYGYYGGLGVQWLNALPHMDLNFDLKFYNKIARDKLLADDPSSSLIPDLFNDIDGAAIYLSHKF